MILALLSIVAVVIVVIFAANRLTMVDYARIISRPGTNLHTSGNSLRVVTWNIGYGALGAGADFYVDGGRHLRALKAPEIRHASRFIADRLATYDADVLLLQEAASASFLTRNVDVKDVIFQHLNAYAAHFWADFRTYLIPPPLRLEHGLASITRLSGEAPQTLRLPDDPKFYAGFLKKYYGGLVTRFPIAGTGHSWVLINIHLSAFDQGASTRHSQIAALFDFAQACFAKGDFVVIGGDWNMRLVPTDFPHQTNDRHLFWVHDMPPDALPTGWSWAVDPKTPTVRTMHEAYVPTQTYTMIIDGFAVSPNVHIDAVTTASSDFAHTDHHPVWGQFSANP